MNKCALDNQDALPFYSPPAQDLLDRINATRYPSQLGPFRAEAARAQLPTDEANLVFDALKARRDQLVVSNNVEPPIDLPEQTPVTQKPWSPTDILETLPKGTREPDWRERQLPNGDRD